MFQWCFCTHTDINLQNQYIWLASRLSKTRFDIEGSKLKTRSPFIVSGDDTLSGYQYVCSISAFLRVFLFETVNCMRLLVSAY
ncbi:hypothetical protein QVD17_17396 [Tagetes erecta]|uniref:Uncharacterized protein n=1 Tax=Tagetes erecta TaxID=13708 RepID=A0AAD8KZE7_TARER|nr:hypothetical protein QVD17_17396 [Tagetes erecta]